MQAHPGFYWGASQGEKQVQWFSIKWYSAPTFDNDKNLAHIDECESNLEPCDSQEDSRNDGENLGRNIFFVHG